MNFEGFLERLSSGDIKALIFDLDGTLLDSMSMWSEVDKCFLKARGKELTQEYTETVKRSTLMQSAVFTIEYYGLNETPEEVIAAWESMIEVKYKSEVPIKKGADQFLRRCRNLGVPIVCATALSRKNAENALINNGVMDLFEFVITLDDLSENVNKGNPLIYKTACEKLGISDYGKCVVFEDIFVALKGASDAGFETCAVYDELSSSEWDKMCDLATNCVPNWAEYFDTLTEP